MRRVLLALFVILLGGLLALAWYVYDKGFTHKWRAIIVSEFRKQGAEVSLRRLTLDPFRGLVAKEVKVYDAKDRRRVLAVIDEVLLGVNYADAARGENFLESLDLRDANLFVPLDPAKPHGGRVAISHLNARLFLPPQQIYLARAEAEICGVKILASGKLINPGAFRPQRNGQTTPGELLERIVKELQEIKYETPPVLTIEFSGDLAHPEELYVKASLQADKLKRKNYRLQHLEFAAAYRHGVAELQQLYAFDSHGDLQACGTYQPATGEAELRARSTLKIHDLLRAADLYPEAWKELVLYEPPALDLSARIQTDKAAQILVSGHVALKRFAVKSEVFERLDGDVYWDGERWSARDLRLAHRSGQMQGDLMRLPNNFRARFSGRMDPHAFQPLVDSRFGGWLRDFEFAEAPRLTVEVRGAAPSLAACTAEGEVDFSKAKFRQAAVLPASAAVRFADGVLTLAPFRLEHGEGDAAQFDLNRNELRLEKAASL